MSKSYTFNIELTITPGEGKVGIDTSARYGYWERQDGSEGGGLWFDEVPGLYREGEAPKLELQDFDGSGTLPERVVNALREAGFVVGEEFIDTLTI